MATWPIKDPSEILDYNVNWVLRLDGDVITASSWVVPAGLTKGAESFNDTTATVWLSGGTESTSYSIENTITTAAGRTMVISTTLPVAQQ